MLLPTQFGVWSLFEVCAGSFHLACTTVFSTCFYPLTCLSWPYDLLRTQSSSRIPAFSTCSTLPARRLVRPTTKRPKVLRAAVLFKASWRAQNNQLSNGLRRQASKCHAFAAQGGCAPRRSLSIAPKILPYCAELHSIPWNENHLFVAVFVKSHSGAAMNNHYMLSVLTAALSDSNSCSSSACQ